MYSLDLVRIYNREISIDDVQKLYYNPGIYSTRVQQSLGSTFMSLRDETYSNFNNSTAQIEGVTRTDSLYVGNDTIYTTNVAYIDFKNIPEIPNSLNFTYKQNNFLTIDSWISSNGNVSTFNGYLLTSHTLAGFANAVSSSTGTVKQSYISSLSQTPSNEVLIGNIASNSSIFGFLNSVPISSLNSFIQAKSNSYGTLNIISAPIAVIDYTFIATSFVIGILNNSISLSGNGNAYSSTNGLLDSYAASSTVLGGNGHVSAISSSLGILRSLPTMVGQANAVSSTSGTLVLNKNYLFDTDISRTFSYSGSSYKIIKIKVRQTSGFLTNPSVEVYYKTASHGYNTGYYNSIKNQIALSNTDYILTFDMSNLTAGGTDYITNTITGIRIDFGNSINQTFQIDWVYIGDGSYTSKLVDTVSLNALTLYNITPSYGVIDTGITFTGLNSFVSGVDTGYPSGSSSRTISFWVNPTSLYPCGLFGYGTESSGQMLQINVDASNNIQVSNFATNAVSSTSELQLGIWQNIAIALTDGNQPNYFMDTSVTGVTVNAGIITTQNSSSTLPEINTLTITDYCHASGTFTITLRGVPTIITVSSLTETSTTLVANIIRATIFNGWAVSGTNDTVIFTANSSGSYKGITYYLNGQKISSTILTGINTILNTLYLGKSSSLSPCFNGSMSEVRIFNTNLTDLQILKLYQSPSNTVFAQNIEINHLRTNTVYQDWNIGFMGAKIPASHTPAWTTFLTGLSAYTFSVNDYLDVNPQEFTHDWKEESQVEFHIHWANNGTELVDKFVKWQIAFTWTNVGDVFPTATVISAEDKIPANTPSNTQFLTDIGTFIPTSGRIASYILMRITRIASTGSAPSSNPFGIAVGMHYQIDTMGSRSLVRK